MAKQNKNLSKAPLLDLHGDNLLDVEAKVDRFLMQAQRKGLSQVRIMTGKGTGKIRAAVQTYLKLGGYTYHFEKSANNQDNEGVLVVHV